MKSRWNRLSYLKKGLTIIAIFAIFNFLETWFFGWHLHAESIAEGFCDMISTVGMCIGMFVIAGHTTGSMVIEWLDEELRK